MAGTDYNLGTAKGQIKVDYDGTGVRKAKDDFGGVSKSAGSSAKALKKTGETAGVAGGAIALGLGLATKVAIDFEKQISAIGAVSGASQADLEAFRKKALQLGADTSFSATQAASAMEELAKAGISVPDILNGAADAAVALAAAGGVELPEAAELAADAMTSFGLAAADLPKVADQIAGAANASSIGVSQFGQSLKQVGAVANLVGISFSDTATAIAVLGANGIKGSDAGTSLKTMLSNLIPSTAKARDTMKELGLMTREGANAFVDAHGEIKPMAEIAQLLQDKTKNLTSAQKQLALETIFGSDAIRAAAILTKSGAAGFDKMAESMGKVTAEEVAAKRLDNTAGAIEQLKGSAETAAIGLASALLPAIVKITKALTTVTNAFNQLSPGMKSTITNVLLAVSALLLAVFAITKIMAAAKAFMVVWKLLNLQFLFSPIGIVVLAIIALVAGIILLWKNSEKFRNFWIGAWNLIKKAAAAVSSWFTEKILPSLKEAWAQLQTLIGFAVKLITGYIKILVAGWKFLWEMTVNFFKLIWTGIKLYFELVVKAITLAINIIKALFNNWLAGLKLVVNGIRKVILAVADHFQAMKDKAIAQAKALITYVQNLPKRISTAIGNLGRLLYNKGRDLVQGLIDGLKSMLGKVREAAGSLIGPLARFLPGSPAKEGPLSGRGYVLKRGQRFVRDFATGITMTAADASIAVRRMVNNVSGQVPMNAAPAVANAARGAQPVNVSPVIRNDVSPTRTISIGNLNITGTWDLGDVDVPRRFVGRLHTELDKYAKGYR